MYRNISIRSANSDRPSISDYFQLTKPRIVVLLAVTGAVAYMLPSTGSPQVLDLLIYILLGYFAAGGAMAVNNAIDFDIDAKMDRTKSRASTGKMTRLHVTIFGTILMLAGIILAAIYFGTYTSLFLAWGGLFYIFGYSILLKRNSMLNTILGGLASPAPVWGGYAARYEITGQLPENSFLGIPLEGWLVGLLVFLWTPTHTWAMAVKNYEDYCRADIPMLPVVLGIRKTALVNLFVGIFVIIFGTYIVWLINPGSLLILAVFNLVFVLSLIRFARQPSVEEGTRNFHAHNLWLGFLFILLL